MDQQYINKSDMIHLSMAEMEEKLLRERDDEINRVFTNFYK